MDVIGSCVRMPKGIPLAFMGLDEAGAVNAALEAVRILALIDKGIDERLDRFIKQQTETVPFAAHD
jgi:phosphoribosylcarboxyaminoimidazole (NCAIR) mutase